MKEKVIFISIDGMRADGILACNHPFVDKMMKLGSYTLEGNSVVPPVTLPCHLSMFYGIPPQRHGISTNTFVPMVRPVEGLFEQIKNAGGSSALYYSWEAIRDVARPGTLKHAEFTWVGAAERADAMLTESALTYIKSEKPDFVFLYMARTDAIGHNEGWMSEAYLQCIYNAIEDVKRVIEEVGDEYTVIITSDHGGHERTHGVEIPEDMIIPMFFIGPDFEAGKKLSEISLLELAPTIADIMGVPKTQEWEGKSIVNVEK